MGGGAGTSGGGQMETTVDEQQLKKGKINLSSSTALWSCFLFAR